MKKTVLFLSFLVSIYCKAQTIFCGTDEFRQIRVNNIAEYKQQEDHQNQLIYNSIVSQKTNEGSRMTVYTIPIVYHIVHEYGLENVADTAIFNSLNELNLRFQNAAPYADATGHPVNIQFCLASVDPWGNPTTGITRDTSFHTNIVNYQNFQETTQLKNVNRWCPATYLNIWIIKSMGGGAAGFSAFPAPNSSIYDGIVVVYPLLAGYVMSHEVGHYLNLQHTFYLPGICTNLNCLIDGDKVCDTPPDFTNDYTTCGGNSCSTEMNDTSGFNPFTSDQNDLPNYMDYTLCPLSFSQGQVTRMGNALTLLRPSLLQSNGCGSHPGGVIPVASFTIDSSYCTGTGTYGFTSSSTNSLYTAWDFDNNGTADDVGDHVVHTFTSSGSHSINLMVTGYGGSDSTVKTIIVFVAPSPIFPIMSYTGLSTDPILHTLFACPGATVTLTADIGLHYLWSTGDTTQSITFIVDTTKSFTVAIVNFYGQTWYNCTPFVVHVNQPLHLTEIVGDDTVNCQELVTLRLLPNPYWFPATNTWWRNGAWFSANQFVLGNYGIPPGLQTVWVTGNVDPIGCVTNSDTVSFFVNPPPSLVITQQGNLLTLNFHCLYTQWMKDGVALSVNDSMLAISGNGCYYAACASCGYFNSDTVCITNVNVPETDFNNSITIYPNPFTSQTTINSIKYQIESIKITDMLGKIVKSEKVTGKSLLLDMTGFEKGIYFVNITDEKENAVNRKIIIQ